MRISLNWLSEFVELPTHDAGEIRDALASLGHEVERVEHLAADWSGVRIARVLTVGSHPNADKVRLCTVTTGGNPIDVVCGAWNFGAGAMVAFAEPGAVLSGGFEIGVREIRGITSNGMICSERELGLGDDHDGILVLDDDAPLGVDFAEWVALPDVVFDLTITPNRPDAMSVLGIARDLAAYFELQVTMPDLAFPTRTGHPSTFVEINDPSGCLRFTGREIQDVRIGPAPFWMRHRLRISGMRPISNAVDVTNYVMLELGHPLHAFDADRIAGERLVVRRATKGETLVTLDDVERDLSPDDLVICDETGPTSLAGTMGGAESEVREDTTRVFLEAATWDPPTIMWMSRRHGLRSEASARFERGVDPLLPLDASARAAKLLAEGSGALVLEDAIDVVAVPAEPLDISLHVAEVVRVLGDGFDSEGIMSLLQRLGMEARGSDPIQVAVPSFRPDVTRPVDLIEEIARLRGYDSFGEGLPTGAAGEWSPEQRRRRRLRQSLVGAGLHETVHLSFIGADDLDAFGFADDDPERGVVVVKNPLRDEESLLRTTLVPGLLRTIRYNRGFGAERVSIFEMGKVFFARPDATDPRIPDQPDRLGIAVWGPFGMAALDGDPRPGDVFTATALVRLIADQLGIDDLLFRPAATPGFHPGRCAEVVVGDAVIGHAGEIHPETVARYDLDGRVAVLEADLSALIAPRDLRRVSSPSTYPPVEFDLAFMVDEGVQAADLVTVTSGVDPVLVERAEVFDEYRGIQGGARSLAVHYVVRAPDRTLTNDDVAPIRRNMAEAAERQLGARLRGET